jgi:single-strand DNA-binding protein
MQPIITLIGRVGKTPEFRTTNGGNKVANFDLANSIRVKNGSEYEDQVTWYKVAMYGADAERIEKAEIDQGDQLTVTGRFSSKLFEKRDRTVGLELKIDGLAFDRLYKKKEN